MGKYNNIGTFDGGVFGGGKPVSGGVPVRINDSAIANGGALISSELEKLDPKISEPLMSITYPRDIRVKVGGGWVETIAKMNIDYGESGGSINGSVAAPGSNTGSVIQMNISKDVWNTHIYQKILRVQFVDMQRQQVTGRSLEQLLTQGIRTSYDKHMDANVYVGLSAYGTTGLLNNLNVIAQPVAMGANNTTGWLNGSKTPDEILTDINNSILAGWAAAGYDLSAIPNHVLVPFEQYNYIATTKVSPIAEKTILTFLLENNVATKNGGDLFIGATSFCKGAGAGGTDRMATYVNHDRFVAVEELVSLTRTMTQPNTDKLSYDSVYMANLSEVEMFYEQPITYWDGI